MFHAHVKGVSERSELTPCIHNLYNVVPNGTLSLSHTLSLPPSTDNKTQYWIARKMSSWSILTFYLAIVVNVLVGFFYPFDRDTAYIGMSKILQFTCTNGTYIKGTVAQKCIRHLC